MRKVNIRNKNHPETPLISARLCDTFLCRLRGLMFRRHMNPGEAVLLVEKRDSRVDASIHMLFVWVKLAVVWINSSGAVVDVRLARPWRPFYAPRTAARYILEMPEERIKDFSVGDQLEFEYPGD